MLPTLFHTFQLASRYFRLYITYLYPGPCYLHYQYISRTPVYSRTLELILLIPSQPHLCPCAFHLDSVLSLPCSPWTWLRICFHLFPVSRQSQFWPTCNGLGSQPTSRTQPLHSTFSTSRLCLEYVHDMQLWSRGGGCWPFNLNSINSAVSGCSIQDIWKGKCPQGG